MTLFTMEGRRIPNTDEYSSWQTEGRKPVIPRDPMLWETGLSDVSGGAESLNGTTMYEKHGDSPGTDLSFSDTQVAASALSARQY